MGESTPLSPLVGRADDVAALADCDTPATLLSGEPGIGKTRLLNRWFASDDVPSAARVLIPVHRAARLDGLEPLRELVGALSTQRAIGSDQHARDDLGEGAAMLRRVRDALAAAAGGGPVRIAIDDLQHAGHGLTDSLAYLVDRLQDVQVRWLFASRGDAPTASALVDLSRAGLLTIRVLSSLTHDESIELMAALDPATTPERAEAIWRRSGGNPLFIELLIRATAAPNSTTLRAVIDERLAGLSPVASHLALAVATGYEPSPSRLAVVARTDRATVDIGLEELHARGILTACNIGDGDGGVMFRHDLLAEATIARAKPVDRDRAYDGWLALAKNGRERIRALEGAGRWDPLATELLREGWRSTERGALDAEEFAARVLAQTGENDPRRFEAFALRARVRIETGRFDEARADFARFIAGRDRFEGVDFARIYGAVASAAVPEFGSDAFPELTDLCMWTRHGAPGAYPTLAHALMLVHYCRGDVRTARDVTVAMRGAPITPQEHLRLDMWDAFLDAQLRSDRIPAASALLVDAFERATALELAGEAARAAFMASFLARNTGDVEAALAWTRRGLDTPGTKPRSVAVALRMQLCEYHLLRGEGWQMLGVALEATAEARFLRRDQRATVAAVLALAQGITGSVTIANQTLDGVDLAGLAPVVAHALIHIRGVIAELDGDHMTAIAAYDSVLERATDAETSLGYAILGRARIAFAADDAATLARLSRRVARSSETLPRTFAPFEFLDALAALVAGDRDRRRLDALGALIDRLPGVVDAALVRLNIGERTGDRHALLHALDAFVKLGTVPLADRARAAARRYGLRLGAPRRQSDTLGERERAVAMGIAAGQTNAEIAASLHLSARTVEKYVSALLVRLGVRSRVDIAGIVLRGQLGASAHVISPGRYRADAAKIDR